MNTETQTAIVRVLRAVGALDRDHERNPDRRIPANVVRDLCGGISDMTLARWLADPAKAFPRPAYIGRRRFWREAEILDWLEARTEVA
ncbi:hypothetical protein [uncultured Paracoccus sp.]|uniref:helix-turn-helix transcriptional regulator n=1 Tax=uncultured Paracoccus sp. TaxID=189685 RepID=UPI0025F3EFDB|nr:hypothetical protein [uncultured Paracoccus sp.]